MFAKVVSKDLGKIDTCLGNPVRVIEHSKQTFASAHNFYRPLNSQTVFDHFFLYFILFCMPKFSFQHKFKLEMLKNLHSVNVSDFLKNKNKCHVTWGGGARGDTGEITCHRCRMWYF